MVAVRPQPRVIDGRFIRLEPLTRQLYPELFAAISTPEVFAGGYGGGPAGYRPTLDGFTEFADSYYALDRNNVYAVRLVDGRLVGTSTLGDFDEVRESAHLGWTAWAPDVWGTAVNPEAKLLILSEAFDNGFGRVKLQADALNTRSRGAITKLGAQFEGIVRRDQVRADGTWRDAAVYSILNDEWPDVRRGLIARLDAIEASATKGRLAP
ncbi:RimJ/RimL family protein N-acetyltransferase [Microbacteriaceae bacterium SG_E_30_P1]|uniref:RimJ/RimL family protein N-acetyltransferase n=1 Tax=Antiquaquibacter oligotrophicus TaxID=2880260 RepID=A0ABT6KSL9_9MICO|nr:GNAT family protein [Antiquaquibacter oligotrophicus]MDH6182498.1 RimJ/RimL family protein N-acetyltransferase [Antiquaquibacter oligotrophicus]UDF14533.1 GNAT family N-acetyltransferase [Antiquaquibacter oligotrophicus]